MTEFESAGVVVYSVERDGRTLDFLSLLPLDDGFERGLPGEAIIGELTAGIQNLSPETFQPNVLFLMFLHQTLAKFARGIPKLVQQGREIKRGELPVFDGRHQAEECEEAGESLAHTIGVFEVQNGQLVQYHICPRFQIVSDEGVMRLPSWLLEILVRELRKIEVDNK